MLLEYQSIILLKTSCAALLPGQRNECDQRSFRANSQRGFRRKKKHPMISRKLSSAVSKYSKKEGDTSTMVFVVTRLKHLWNASSLYKQISTQLLQYLFAPDGEMSNIALARITICAVALINFDDKLKYVTGKQIPHENAVRTVFRRGKTRREKYQFFFRMRSLQTCRQSR